MVATLFALVLLTVAFAPFSGQQAGSYDPWLDYNDDGVIDVYDLAALAEAYGSSGEPLNAPLALEYNSGWLNITDQRGQYFNVTHNLGTTNVILEIRGKTAVNTPAHQRYLDAFDYTTIWKKTFGGTEDDEACSLVETGDGGYALAGYTLSFGAGGYDFWLVKTDNCGFPEPLDVGLTLTEVNANTLLLYRGAIDRYWNYVRVNIWVVKENP